MAPTIEDQLKGYTAAVAEAKDVLRELHGEMKEARAAIKQMEGFRKEIEQWIDTKADPIIAAHLSKFFAELTEKQHKAYDSILKGFDEAAKPLMAAFDEMDKKQAELLRKYQ